jgi:hypothetical protein
MDVHAVKTADMPPGEGVPLPPGMPDGALLFHIAPSPPDPTKLSNQYFMSILTEALLTESKRSGSGLSCSTTSTSSLWATMDLTNLTMQNCDSNFTQVARGDAARPPVPSCSVLPGAEVAAQATIARAIQTVIDGHPDITLRQPAPIVSQFLTSTMVAQAGTCVQAAMAEQTLNFANDTFSYSGAPQCVACMQGQPPSPTPMCLQASQTVRLPTFKCADKYLVTTATPAAAAPAPAPPSPPPSPPPTHTHIAWGLLGGGVGLVVLVVIVTLAAKAAKKRKLAAGSRE